MQIRINDIRAKQLATLASSLSISVSKVIDQLCSGLMQNGLILDRFDDFTIDRKGDLTLLTLGREALAPMSFDELDRLIGELCDFVKGTLGPIMRHELVDGKAIVLQRAGQAFRFSLHEDQAVLASVMFSRTIMVDIIRQLVATSSALVEDMKAPKTSI